MTHPHRKRTRQSENDAGEGSLASAVSRAEVLWHSKFQGTDMVVTGIRVHMDFGF